MRVVVGDEKSSQVSMGSIVGLQANVKSYSNYYAFGMTMPGRQYSSGEYRFGFNGKENDSETGWQDYGMRMYHPALGRFFNVDPITSEYPELTPYQFASNRTIDGIDQDGLEWMEMDLVWDEATGKPAVVHISQQETSHGDKLPLVYFVNYNGEQYRFFENPNPAYPNNPDDIRSPENSIENFDNWLESANSMEGFEERFQSQKEWENGVMDIVMYEWALGLSGARGYKTQYSVKPVTSKPSTLNPGPYAKESIPARSASQKFTSTERNAINKIGEKSGCHTCGTTQAGTKSGNFVPDHQPPSRLNINNSPQVLYPHCISCSRTQGGEVRKEIKSTFKPDELFNQKK